MILNDEDISRFRQAYEDSYGEEIPIEKARVEALRLVRIYQLLYSPTPSEEMELLANSYDSATLNETSSRPSVDSTQSPPQHK